jgi:predicted dehydrogenase
MEAIIKYSQAYGNYKELLNAPDIDVVHNCTPNHLRYEINKEIIEAGKRNNGWKVQVKEGVHA